jgi:ElaB/YqjD/DUF883 family membrane-anchored ribosome-binding protein
MNDKQLADKVRKDAEKVKKDVNTLVEDGSAQVSRFGGRVSQATGQAKEGLTTWVEDGVSDLSEGFEKLTDEARESVVDAAATVKKDVGHGLRQYNAKIQKVAEKVPGDLDKKVAKYPWVAISIALVVGFILGSMLKPAR